MKYIRKVKIIMGKKGFNCLMDWKFLMSMKIPENPTLKFKSRLSMVKHG